MNFTREPLIETIITPKEGYKLLVRGSKTTAQEEYLVDALEVVTFGHSFFFRSLERPKPFLVPVNDYEIVEVKETRVALKSATYERNIKIGGGRDAPIRPQREPSEGEEEQESSTTSQEGDVKTEGPRDRDRKRDRGGRRHRRRRPDDWSEQRPKTETAEGEDSPASDEETRVVSSMFSALIPPPTTLISDTISRYKDFVISPKEQVEGNLADSDAPPLENEEFSSDAENAHSPKDLPADDV